MKAILRTLVILAVIVSTTYIVSLVKPPAELKKVVSGCPFTINDSEAPVMVVRMIDNSTLPKEFVKRCIMNQMTEKNGIIFINRENEPHILNELAHQSDIPASEKHIQPIGEILVPSHLFVINQKDTWVDVSLSEIKSGIYIFKEEFEYSLLIESIKKNVVLAFVVVLWTIVFVISYVFSNIFLKPTYQWLQHKEDVQALMRKFELARYHISQNEVRKAGDLLVECARSPINCDIRTNAALILKNLSTMIGATK
jgi:hypothetical protein